MKNHTTQADMALQNRVFSSIDPVAVPFSYKIDGEEFTGIPKFFRPTVTRALIDTSITEYTVTGRHMSGIEVRAVARVYHDFAVTDWVAYFSNERETPSPIVSDIRFSGVIAGENPVLESNNGDPCNELGYTITETALTNGAALSFAPVGGTPCCGAGPYMRLSFDGWGANIAIGFPAGWTANVAGLENGASLSVGQARCHMSILPGEVIRTPRMVLQAYEGDNTRGRNAWRQFYFAHILPRENGQPIPPKLCLHVWNVDGPEFTGTTEKKQLEGLSEYIRRGMKPDIWWFDAGWYPCNFDWPHTGTWDHDPERFPRGLGPIGQACEDNGVQFLLWFEPERVRADTDLYNNHRDWILDDNETGDYLLYLGNPEACNWLIHHVDTKIKDYHIHIYRQDFNFSPTRYFEKHESADRIGAMENLHMQGYLRYWDALIDANPGLWMDSCASGGRRNDIETMRRAVPLHYTDVGYGNHPIKQKQHRLMFEWIPYFRAHNMSWDNENGEYTNGGKPVDKFAFHCALAPALTNMTFYDSPDTEFDTASEMLPVWRRAAELELRGDYYPLTACNADPHDWYAMQFDDPDTGEGFVQIIRNTQVEEDTYTLHMVTHGNPDDLYFFENMETGDMMQLTGAQLDAGIPITLSKREGVVWFYHTVSFDA